MNDKLTWEPLVPTQDELELMKQYEAFWKQVINAFALTREEIGCLSESNSNFIRRVIPDTPRGRR